LDRGEEETGWFEGVQKAISLDGRLALGEGFRDAWWSLPDSLRRSYATVHYRLPVSSDQVSPSITSKVTLSVGHDQLNDTVDVDLALESLCGPMKDAFLKSSSMKLVGQLTSIGILSNGSSGESPMMEVSISP